jgi:hypothetical protein
LGTIPRAFANRPSKHDVPWESLLVSIARGGIHIPQLAMAAALVWGAACWVHGSEAAPLPNPAAPRFATPTSSVRAGDRVEIRWGALPSEVDELELLLSVDGGRSYPLRVSPELDGHEISFVWSVPNLAVAAARVRLRMRYAGVEIESEATSGFEIQYRADAPRDYELVHEGQWWAGPDGYETGPAYDSMRPGGPRFVSGAHHPAAVESPRSSVPEPFLASPSPHGSDLLTAVDRPSPSFATPLRFCSRRE